MSLAIGVKDDVPRIAEHFAACEQDRNGRPQLVRSDQASESPLADDRHMLDDLVGQAVVIKRPLGSLGPRRIAKRDEFARRLQGRCVGYSQSPSAAPACYVWVRADYPRKQVDADARDLYPPNALSELVAG
jgi:hypothetical protein